MFLNLKSKAAKLSIQYCEYFFLGVYGYFSNIHLTTNGDIAFDTYYTLIRDFFDIITKHTLFRFNKLSDIVVYDRPQFRMRFLLNYVVTNPFKELKLRVRFYGDAYLVVVPSITTILSSASWAEREAMDLFGLKFLGHPDLRRILGDYGLWGFPGRKDFPVVGQFSYFYSLNFLRVFRIKGTIQDFWATYFQKRLYKEFKITGRGKRFY